MSKGTILYVGGFELPDKNAAAHRVLSNAKILRELGYKVVFIDVDKSLDNNTDFLSTKKIVQGFECWSVPYPKTIIEWLKYLSNINPIKLLNIKYCDIKAILAYNYPANALLNLKKYCTTNNIKIIADCTEWYNTKGFNVLYRIVKGLDSFLRMRIIQKRLDGLIVISKYLEGYYKNLENMLRLPPLVDLNEQKWNISPTVWNDDKVRLIYSGSPGRNKDKINILIEILYSFKEFPFLLKVVGITKDQYINSYPEQTEIIHDMEDKILFLGRVPHTESLKLIKDSDFSMFIRDNNKTTRAGFPTKFAEGISCGTPIITTKTSDLEDYLQNGKNGFFIEPKVTQESLKVIETILTYSKENIMDMKDYCHQSELFDYKKYINSVEKFLSGILNN